ncbi:MAG TPA: patatin-like phospholipase family protein [Burkholderiaceae bacterium]
MSRSRRVGHGRVVLVMPGGGALGAYQAGVYEALAGAGLEPDWVIGTSIGAINAALIAGNPKGARLDRLREFWQRVEQKPSLGTWSIVAGGLPAFFTPRPHAWAGSHVPVGLDQASYYTTEPLRRTLRELVDTDLLAKGRPRITVGAVAVRSGQMKYFDSRHETLGIDHIMASGALPPAFPAVRIDGEAYWDGGIYSNTPVEPVIEDHPRRSALIFAVNVWQRTAPEPRSIWEVMARQKDIQFASRADSHIARHKQIHHMRRLLHDLLERWPGPKQQIPRWLDLAAHGADTTVHVVRLMAPPGARDDVLKDVDFTRSGIRERWSAGHRDALQAISRAAWNDPADPMQGVFVHEPQRSS